MGAKKKKKSRRVSQSETDADYAILTEILTAPSGSRTQPSSSAENIHIPPSAAPAPVVKEEEKDKEASTETVVSPATNAEIEQETGLGTGSRKKDGKCQHVKNAVKLPKLRKGIGHVKDWDHCQGCLKAEAKTKKEMQRLEKSMTSLSLTDTKSAVKALPSESLWLCLTCCDINCGRSIHKHALEHHDGKDNNHPLAVNLGTMDCWCYDCDDEIVPLKNKNQVIQECQAAIRKTRQEKQSKSRSVSAAISKKTKGSSSSGVITVASTPKGKVYTPGLQNLGNTCFFNSVVQVLTETKSLKQILSEDEKEWQIYPTSLAARTDAGLGPLTTTFKDFLHTMWKQRGGTVVPRDLFMQITKKWKVFRGFRQQDSQELMRYLLDGIKQEELNLIKRQQAEEKHERKTNGQESEADGEAESDSDENANTVDEKEAPKYIPFIDSCFSGKLVSVIVCDVCKECTYAPEDFFDLSLPVRGPIQARASTSSSLKARLLARSKGHVSNPIESEPRSEIDSEADEKDAIPESAKPSERHLRHVEKLLKSIGQPDSEDLSIQRSLNQFTSVDCLDGENKFACENCYKLHPGKKDKESNSREEKVVEDQVTEPTASGETLKNAREDVSNSDQNSGDISEPATDSKTKTSLESEDAKENKEDKKKKEGEESENAKEDKEDKEDEEDEDDREDKEDKEEEEETDRFGNNIPKTLSKLKSTTKLEQKEEPKYVFRKAFKRYLISSLPPTLVLHLKRFEQSGRFGQMRKIEDHVEIPVELDMSPYFVPTSEIEDEDEEHHQHQDDGKSKKYRLYGAVVHMGTLGGGHYTNYVLSSKVELRETVETKDKANGVSVKGHELLDVPLSVMQDQHAQKKKLKKKVEAAKADMATTTCVETEQQKEAGSEAEEAEEEEEVGVDKRQWIACSDSSVRLSSLEEVLASRAYLLFYERC